MGTEAAKLEQQRRRIKELEAAMQRCAEIIDSGDRAPRTDAEMKVLTTLVSMGEGGQWPREKWLDVKVYAPTKRKKLLVIYESGYEDPTTKVTVGRTLNGRNFELATDVDAVIATEAGGDEFNVVTHWQPLPNPPGGADDDHKHWP